ncbi:Long-chain-fatty-acid--CoA ligase [compost metagenome]
MYITQGLHRHLQRRPNDTVIRYQGRGLSFAEFGERVARLAGALKKLGVSSGDRVAMLSLTSHRYLEYFQAVPWADAVLNPVNIRWSAAEIIYSLDDSESSVLIVDDAFKELGARVASQARTIRTVIYAGDGECPEGMFNYELLIADNEPVEDARRGGDSLLGIFYTGGTTGFPKGVMLSHNNLVVTAMALLDVNTVNTQSRYLHVMPMFHLADISVMAALFMAGGTHVVLPSFIPRQVMETISSERITSVVLAPSMLQMLLDTREAEHDLQELDFTSLERLMYGASPITPTLLNRARSVFISAGFAQGYGMSELAPVATLLLPEHHCAEYQANGKMYSAGLPAICVEVRIVDGDDREVPRGTPGEIVVRGPNVMLGYWNKPEATAEVLRGGWMHTGDGGYMDEDGFVYVCDRIKDMIVTGGENVYSAEVETAIASHPDVAQSAVIAIPCEKWGETVHAVVVLKPGARATEEEIVVHCRGLIAGYKVPRSVEFREALPMSSIGKVLKADLRAPFWEGRKRGVA